MTTQTKIDPQALAAMIPGEEEEVSLSAPNGSVNAASPGIGAANPMFGYENAAPALAAPGRKAPVTKTSKSLNQARATIDAMLPSALRVHVYKRSDDAKLAFVNDYSSTDLAGSGTIEAFLHRYVVSDYGYGEYHLYQHDPQNPSGRPVAIGSVRLIAPITKTEESNKTSSVRELWEIAQKMQEQQAAAQMNRKSPIEEMASMMAMLKQMGMMPENKGGGDSGMSMMMMMMMMERMRPQPTGPDPMLMTMMQKLVERSEDERMMHAMIPPAPPPPPPPAPTVDPMTPVMQLLVQQQQQSTQLLVEALRGNKQDRDPIRDLADMAKLIESKNGEALTIKDMFTLIPQLKDILVPKEAHKDPFEKTIENFRLFKLMQREFGEAGTQQEDQGASGFWDFAKSLLTSDLGSGLASAIAAGNAGAAVQQRTEVRQHQMASTAHQVAQSRGSQLPAPRPLPAPQPVVVQQSAPPPAPQSQDEAVTIPDGFVNRHAPKINNSATDVERIPAIVDGFRFLGTDPGFRPHIVEVFGLTKMNRKQEALEKLHWILGGLVDAEVLSPTVPDVAVEDFKRHWNVIRQKMGFDPNIPEIGPDGKPVPVEAKVEPKVEEKPVVVEEKIEEAVVSKPVRRVAKKVESNDSAIAAAPVAPRPVPPVEDDEEDDEEAPVERPRPRPRARRVIEAVTNGASTVDPEKVAASA